MVVMASLSALRISRSGLVDVSLRQTSISSQSAATTE
jgi:hypothetical protein